MDRAHTTRYLDTVDNTCKLLKELPVAPDIAPNFYQNKSQQKISLIGAFSEGKPMRTNLSLFVSSPENMKYHVRCKL